jgi:hypothetical protein
MFPFAASRLRSHAVLAGCAILTVAALYLAGRYSGAITLVGYDSKRAPLAALAGTGQIPIRFGVPVWLDAGEGIRADFDVEAGSGAVAVSVSPPALFDAPRPAATAHIEGKRAGTLVFTAAASGWYSFRAEPTRFGEPRCKSDWGVAQLLAGGADCPAGDVQYSIAWHAAAPSDPHSAARLAIPGPDDAPVDIRIGE